MTGFRVWLGGTRSLHKVTPGLSSPDKGIGGGMRVDVFGNKSEFSKPAAWLVNPGMLQAGVYPVPATF